MKPKNEFEKFDDVMDKLLSVPYSELQKKLDEEKEAKKTRPDTTASSGRVSSKNSSA